MPRKHREAWVSSFPVPGGPLELVLYHAHQNPSNRHGPCLDAPPTQRERPWVPLTALGRLCPWLRASEPLPHIAPLHVDRQPAHRCGCQGSSITDTQCGVPWPFVGVERSDGTGLWPCMRMSEGQQHDVGAPRHHRAGAAPARPPAACRPPAVRMVVRHSKCSNFFVCRP